MLDDFEKSKVTVKKAELLYAMKKNRALHHAVFVEVQKGFREAVIGELDRMLADARTGRKLRTAVGLVAPQEHTADYDRVICMLEMSVADEVSVSERQFAQYVLDDWGWKREFVRMSMPYSTTAVQNYGIEGGDAGDDEGPIDNR